MTYVTSKSVGALLLLVATCCTGPAHSADSVQTSRMTMAVEIGRCDSRSVQLKLTVTNTGGKTIDASEARLPWGMQEAIRLVAITNDVDEQHLERAGYLIHRAPDAVTIPLGKSVSGSLDLTREFPDLNRTLKSREIIVFWSYQLETDDKVRLPRVNGSIGIRRFGEGSSQQQCVTF